MKTKLMLGILVVLLAGFTGVKVSDYSYSHPYLFHDCRRLQSLCPSGDAEWAPPGGVDPSQRYLYGACACAASVHAVVGT